MLCCVGSAGAEADIHVDLIEPLELAGRDLTRLQALDVARLPVGKVRFELIR
ncbi:hypothetical protein D3C85_1248470 [compost metagenome]